MWNALEKPTIPQMLLNVSEALLESTANLGPDNDERGINGYADFSADEECTVNLMMLQEIFLTCSDGSFADKGESIKMNICSFLAPSPIAFATLFRGSQMS